MRTSFKTSLSLSTTEVAATHFPLRRDRPTDQRRRRTKLSTAILQMKLTKVLSSASIFWLASWPSRSLTKTALAMWCWVELVAAPASGCYCLEENADGPYLNTDPLNLILLAVYTTAKTNSSSNSSLWQFPRHEHWTCRHPHTFPSTLSSISSSSTICKLQQW